jgi:predicted dehydrogenase
MGGVHARAAVSAGASVVAVSGSTAARAAEAAASMAGAPDPMSFDDLLDARPDVVHICAPNSLHRPLAEAVIAAGIHVVCEKPLATSVSAAGELTAAAAAAGLVATVPFVYRYYPSVLEARARIAADPENRLWLLHGSYLQDWLSEDTAVDWRVDPAIGGASRAFGDIGVHWCDLMEFATGQRIVAVQALLANAFAARGERGSATSVSTEDGGVLLFRTDRGAAGSVVVSQASAGRKNRLWFSFDGAETSYSFDQELPESLWLGRRDGGTVLPRDPSRGTVPTRRTALPAGHPQGYQTCFDDFVADTYTAISGAPVAGLPTFADGLRAATITAAVLASDADRRWVELP